MFRHAIVVRHCWSTSHLERNAHRLFLSKAPPFKPMVPQNTAPVIRQSTGGQLPETKSTQYRLKVEGCVHSTSCKVPTRLGPCARCHVPTLRQGLNTCPQPSAFGTWLNCPSMADGASYHQLHGGRAVLPGPTSPQFSHNKRTPGLPMM